MESKAYVKKYFPDAYFEWIGDDGFVYSKGNTWLDCMGIGSTEEEAWEDAKQWIDSQPDLMNNFKPE